MTGSKDMLYRMAYRMAMADGELSANEALVLHIVQQSFGLSKEQVRCLREEATALRLEDLPRLVPRREDRLTLFETGCLMAMVDGRSDPQEWNLIIRLCEIFDIDRPEAQECLARTRDRLARLAKDHNLLDEMMARQSEEAGSPDQPDSSTGEDDEV